MRKKIKIKIWFYIDYFYIKKTFVKLILRCSFMMSLKDGLILMMDLNNDFKHCYLSIFIKYCITIIKCLLFVYYN